MVKKYVGRDWLGFGLLLVALILPSLGMALPLAGELHHTDELTKASVVGEGYLTTTRCSVGANPICAGGPQANSPCTLGEQPRSLCVDNLTREGTCSTGYGFGWDNCSGTQLANSPQGVVHNCNLAGGGFRWMVANPPPMGVLPQGCGQFSECVQ